eukprot:GHVT01078646.1.p1 GENE.GHVT01078646.1~~GHVT01078646.1.p1  ORF type:complete len:426 (+),score=41.00 GHVT01078646.1:97-1374(+)
MTNNKGRGRNNRNNRGSRSSSATRGGSAVGPSDRTHRHHKYNKIREAAEAASPLRHCAPSVDDRAVRSIDLANPEIEPRGRRLATRSEPSAWDDSIRKPGLFGTPPLAVKPACQFFSIATTDEMVDGAVAQHGGAPHDADGIQIDREPVGISIGDQQDALITRGSETALESALKSFWESVKSTAGGVSVATVEFQDLEYQGYNAKVTAQVYAEKAQAAETITYKKKVIGVYHQLVFMMTWFVVRGATVKGPKVDSSTQSDALELLKQVVKNYGLANNLTGARSPRTLTLPRLASAFPQIVAVLLRIGKGRVLAGDVSPELPRWMRFSGGPSLIGDSASKRDFEADWNAWNAAQTEIISRGPVRSYRGQKDEKDWFNMSYDSDVIDKQSRNEMFNQLMKPVHNPEELEAAALAVMQSILKKALSAE